MSNTPTVEEIMENFDAFQTKYKQAKREIEQRKGDMPSQIVMKKIFDVHVLGKVWNPEAVIIVSHKEGMHFRHSYLYRDGDVWMEYLSCIEGCDMVVRIDGVFIYEKRKDKILVDRCNINKKE